MSGHTATPWHFEELESRPDGCGYIRCETDRLEISHHGDTGRSREENLANAAFIVTACNSHAELVTALEDSRAAIASLPMEALGYASAENDQAHWPIRDELLHKIDTALATLTARKVG